MKHFAAICDPSPSHMMAMCAIGRELERRGHRFTMLNAPEMAASVGKEGVQFVPLGQPGQHPVTAHHVSMRRQRGVSATSMRTGLGYLIDSVKFIYHEFPSALPGLELDCLLIDQDEPAAASCAEAFRIPWVTVCHGIPLEDEPGIPPFFLPWRYQDTALARLRNRFAYFVRDQAIRPLNRALNEVRRKWGLADYRKPADSFSPFAQLSQLVAEFDLPHKDLPEWFHYVGPFRDRRNTAAEFPYERLDGRPLVYASLGTILDGSTGLWRTIAESCAGIGVQLVLSLGGQARIEDYADLPGRPIVVSWAPQRELLKRARLVITPAGLNTTLEALSEGVPLVAAPAVNDQFGVAARIAWSGAGDVVDLPRVRVDTLRRAVRGVLADMRFKDRAEALKSAIHRTSGVSAAADIAEQVAASMRPVPVSR